MHVAHRGSFRDLEHARDFGVTQTFNGAEQQARTGNLGQGLEGFDQRVIKPTLLLGDVPGSVHLDGWLRCRGRLLEIAGVDLAVLHRAEGLTEAGYTVPAEAVAGVEPGDRLLWGIEATEPDGSKTASRTFVVVLQ